jgi:hypothetical protein
MTTDKGWAKLQIERMAALIAWAAEQTKEEE